MKRPYSQAIINKQFISTVAAGRLLAVALLVCMAGCQGGGSGGGEAGGGGSGGGGSGGGGGGGDDPGPDGLPAESLRIVTLGDSVTEGVGDVSGEAGGFPRRLLSEVERIRPGSTLLNVGHSGWTSSELIVGMGDPPSELEQAVAADPDIATVWIGSNDLWRLYEFGPETGTSSELEADDLAAFTENIETILTRLDETGAAVYVGLLDDQSLRPVASDRATLPNTTPDELAQMSAQVTRYNDVLIAAAERHGATLVDFFNTSIFTDAATLDPDGIHPNSAGYDVIAEMWFAAIEPTLD